ncbi:MAG: N-acyl-D-glucosamine 2-epimerase [Sphingobacteriaceae bacterium]|nr:MAG: N-acyl-D-glucosamine 2-epimerase [Sphingobacteriaceae bacterium]
MDQISIDKSVLRDSFQNELISILKYWSTYTIDLNNGGFYGELSDNNEVLQNADKGSVLNTRILWSFSAAYNLNQTAEYLILAERAFNYICKYFIDPEFGGIYWSVNAQGKPKNAKKQIYAIAFAIYGLSEYYKASKDKTALTLAIKLHNDIEQHSFDTTNGGYLEAFTQKWYLIDDLRLSNKDANEKKTMNTHLHILEAYTNLYSIWPDNELNNQLKKLINYFEQYFINHKSFHLNLFLDENWAVKSDTISYGHDIEASWLLLRAAEVLNDHVITERVKKAAVKIAYASAKGINNDGSLNYEHEPSLQKSITERHWWVQAEAVVGYYNAFQITAENHFLNKSVSVWNYTKQYIIDHKKGEWFWGINNDGSVMNGHGKVGFWKCPYHNSRACIEMVNRLN